MTMGLRARVAGVTDVGLRRAANEDALLLRDDVSLWTVADGMGGHKNGQWASAQVKAALEGLMLTDDFEANFRRIEEAVHAANATIAEAGEEARSPMGTTVAILHCVGSRFAIFWAGDSRVYLQRDGELCQMTTDHTHVQDLVDKGVITPEEAAVHPNKHILSRAVGAERHLVLDAIVDQIEPNDTFLICSDGLTGVVSDTEIRERVSRYAPEEAVKDLLKLVLERGAPDNVTIVAVACDPGDGGDITLDRGNGRDP
jgi:serine/threonine protein phosphatase PrpC